jgi:3' exoribonuclease, RNase T-like
VSHIMLDLETLDSAPTAAIVSIGAVKMDLEKFELGEEFYQIIKPSNQWGLTIGADTVLWWLQQAPEAQVMFRAPAEQVTDLYPALKAFSAWAGEVQGVWGNGATFDNVILRNAYLATGLKAPWSYRQDFCYRTMYRNFPGDQSYAPQGVKHNALDDARNQAAALVEIFRKLKGGA